MPFFEFHRLRFYFDAKDRIVYPQSGAANVIRGALGVILRSISCTRECQSARTCEFRGSCAYARIFEPVTEQGPSGLHDSPRPFVLRAAHLDALSTIQPGERFHFDIHLFLTKEPPLGYFLLAFARLAEAGLGPTRGRIALTRVESLPSDEQGGETTVLLDGGRLVAGIEPLEPVRVPLPCEFNTDSSSVVEDRLRVRFVTPTEIKHQGSVVSRPEFSLLITRVAERLGNLSEMYGSGPLDWDWKNIVTAARDIQLFDFQTANGPSPTSGSNVQHQRTRYSTKTGQKHGLGGIVGTAIYGGKGVTQFRPLLVAGKYCGIGRHTVWGNGMIEA